MFVMTIICHSFVVTSILSSQQKIYLWQLLPLIDMGAAHVLDLKDHCHFARRPPSFCQKTTVILPANDGGLGSGVKHGSHAQVHMYQWQELPQV